jgi:outer membrane protein TolC
MKIFPSQLPAMLFLLFALTSGGCHPDRLPVFDYSPPPTPPVEKTSVVQFPSTVNFRYDQDHRIQVPEEGPLELSLEQASVLTLRNNQDLQVSQLQPVITGAFEEIERGTFDPELFMELETFEEEALETSRSTEDQFPVKGTETSGIAGLRQKLPTGTTLEATVEQERNISNREPEQQQARVGLTLTQSLLRGFGPAVNLVRVRQAELNTLVSEYQLRGFTEALLAETETAYWNYVLAQQEISIFEESLAVARKQHDEIAFRIEVGILPEIEIAAARAEIARREQALIEARSIFEERRLLLLRLLNSGVHGRLERTVIATSKPFIEPKPLNDLTDRIALARQSRPDLKEAGLLLERNRLETIVTRNGLLPRLDFFIALGQTGYADTFTDSFRELDGNTYDFTVGVRINHFLGNRTARAKDLAARASRLQAVEAVANLRQLVELDVRLAANEVERTRQQIAASRITRNFEEETLKAEQERFDVGSSTALLVAQAQRDLLVSRIAEVRAVVNYRIALVKLYLAEGSLLERRGIEVGPVTPPQSLL